MFLLHSAGYRFLRFSSSPMLNYSYLLMRYFLRLLIFFIAYAIGVSFVHAEPVVYDVRGGVHTNPDKTRFVIDISNKVDFHIEYLTDPYRLVVNLPVVNWQVPVKRGSSKRFGLIENWRHGYFAFKKFGYRIVIVLKGPAITKGVMLLPRDERNKYRLVVDLMSSSKKSMLAQRSNGQEFKNFVKTNIEETMIFQPPGRKPNYLDNKKIVVVIDPGHGGIDPGATTKSGVYEKHVVLAVAKVFKKRLERNSRYRVFLTREKDVFVRLRERIAIARERKADLFVSLHADAIKNKNVRGISVYTLSENASSKEAAALAEKENKSDFIAGVEGEEPIITNILIDLAQTRSMNESIIFAKELVKRFRLRAKVLPKPQRKAGFAVLKSPDTISVLVELGFLSNPRDSRALLKKSYQAKIANAFFIAVENYCNQSHNPCNTSYKDSVKN